MSNLEPNARAMSVSLAAYSGHASPSAPVRAQTTLDALPARPPCSRYTQHDGTRQRRVLSRRATLQHPRVGGMVARHSQSATPRACSVPEECAFDFGRPRRDACLARCVLGPGEHSPGRFRSQAAHRDPHNNQLIGRSLTRVGKGAGSTSASVRSASSDATYKEKARTSRCRRVRGVQPVPCPLSVTHAASSALPGRPRIRATSAISSLPATTRPLTASNGLFHTEDTDGSSHREPSPRTELPSCAIAMPRSTRASSSTRRATHFNARGDHPLRVHALQQ